MAHVRRSIVVAKVAGGRHAVTYGGNLLRLVAGARVDRFSSIDKAVFSPRVAAVFKPRGDQSIRVSYDRAFRARSMINNNLEMTIATPLPLGQINPAFGNQIFLVPTAANGNTDLKEESVEAFEVAYTGTLRDRGRWESI